MGTHLRRIATHALILLAPLVFSACGAGDAPPPKPIDNPLLSSTLKVGNQELGFPGMASYIDTKVVFQGGDMFLGLSLDTAVKALIIKNCNSFLMDSPPSFDGGPSPSASGVTVNAALKKITFKTGDVTVSWLFSGNSVVRSYAKTAAAEPSTWTFTYNPATGLTSASFVEPVSEAVAGSTTTRTSYSGSMKYVHAADYSLTSLTSAEFTQTHMETDSSTARTMILNGNVKMSGTTATGGDLTFAGGFSFDLPPYGTVTGTAGLTNGTYGPIRANISNGILTIASQTDYSHVSPSANPLSLQGVWLGTFTDSCAATPGTIVVSISAATAIWVGISSDLARIYGAQVAIDANGLHLKNNALSWGDSSSISATAIAGSWSSGSCNGTLNVLKQP